jgi:hypothetical protein
MKKLCVKGTWWRALALSKQRQVSMHPSVKPPRIVRGILLAGLLALLCGGPANAQTVGPPALYCNKSFVISVGATSLVQVVAAVPGQAIHICGYDLNAGAAAATFQLTVGTGTNCSTNVTNVTPVFTLGVNGVLVSRPGDVWFSSIQGAQLCYVTTGTGPLNAVVSYGQY